MLNRILQCKVRCAPPWTYAHYGSFPTRLGDQPRRHTIWSYLRGVRRNTTYGGALMPFASVTLDISFCYTYRPCPTPHWVGVVSRRDCVNSRHYLSRLAVRSLHRRSFCNAGSSPSLLPLTVNYRRHFGGQSNVSKHRVEFSNFPTRKRDLTGEGLLEV